MPNQTSKTKLTATMWHMLAKVQSENHKPDVNDPQVKLMYSAYNISTNFSVDYLPGSPKLNH